MNAAITIVATGTSLTAKGGWTEPLRAQLEHSMGAVRLECVAKPGASSRWGVQQIPAIVALRPDVVLIEFAINDAAIDRVIGLRRSKRNVEHIVRGIQEGAPSAKIILMTMSPTWGWKSWIRPRLDQYYAQYREISARIGVGFVDGNKQWKRLTRGSLRAAIPDRSHPLADRTVEILLPEIIHAILAIEQQSASSV